MDASDVPAGARPEGGADEPQEAGGAPPSGTQVLPPAPSGARIQPVRDARAQGGGAQVQGAQPRASRTLIYGSPILGGGVVAPRRPWAEVVPDVPPPPADAGPSTPAGAEPLDRDDG